MRQGIEAPDIAVLALAGFAVVHARPGETVTAEVRVAARALQHWSVDAHRWETEPGGFELTAEAVAATRRTANNLRRIAPRNGSGCNPIPV